MGLLLNIIIVIIIIVNIISKLLLLIWIIIKIGNKVIFRWVWWAICLRSEMDYAQLRPLSTWVNKKTQGLTRLNPGPNPEPGQSWPDPCSSSSLSETLNGPKSKSKWIKNESFHFNPNFPKSIQYNLQSSSVHIQSNIKNPKSISRRNQT